MFLGELFCMAAYGLWLLYRPASTRITAKDKNDPPFSASSLALPAACDLLAACLLNAGLTMTHASVYQMLCGSVVIFTGLLSILFLGRRLALYHWAGIALVATGAFIVGLRHQLHYIASDVDRVVYALGAGP